MLLDKLCRMGMTFVDPLTLRDNPKKKFLPTISVWFKNCGRFANDQFANVLGRFSSVSGQFATSHRSFRKPSYPDKV